MTWYRLGNYVFTEDVKSAHEHGKPVVVIDPEDREQVERLARIIFGPMATAVGDLAVYLREFADPTPPRPDEPMGLFAVVEDEPRARWVRCYDSDTRVPWNRIGTDVWAVWDDIAAVRVLSEGVS